MQTTATIIGRGHSGTRCAAEILSMSGFYMGPRQNESSDLLPLGHAYEAARIIGARIRHLGGLDWDFESLRTCPIDPAWAREMDAYLAPVLSSSSLLRGWKLPETLLSYPWLARRYPEVKCIWWLRDPRDCILQPHATDCLLRFGVAGAGDEDAHAQRAISWVYQYKIVQSVSAPRLTISLERYVQNPDEALADVGRFLGVDARGPTPKPDVVGRWRQANLCPPALDVLAPYT